MSKKHTLRYFSNFEWILALRYLRSQRKDGFISVIAGFSFLGIAVGVATMIVVLAVMNGFRKELMDKFLGFNGHIVAHSLSHNFSESELMRQRIMTVEGVRLAFPFIENAAMASKNGQAVGVLVRGLTPPDMQKITFITGSIRQGTSEGFDSRKGILIGARLAEKLRVFAGDQVTLLVPRGAYTPFGVTPRALSYKVLGIFEVGMSEYDAAFVFMPLNEAQFFLNKKEKISGIEIFVKNPDEINLYRDRIERVVGRDFYLVDWAERNRTIFSALQVERNVMFLILTQIILVAMLNIVSGLIMLVKDKGEEIGVLRALGATRGAIMRIFFLTGASIGITGTVTGLCAGVLMCWNIDKIQGLISKLTGTEVFFSELYYLSQLPAELDVGETIMVAVMSLFLSFIATLYPAWRAAHLDPVEALRYE